MVDMLSSCWDLSDNALLTYFNAHFPQRQSWRICHLQHNYFSTDLGLISKVVQSRVTTSYTRKIVGNWELWLIFGSNIGSNPCLISFMDPIPYLQVFGAQYQDRSITPCGHGLKSAMVSDAIQLFGPRFSGMGTMNPRLNTFSNIKFYSYFLSDTHFIPTHFSLAHGVGLVQRIKYLKE